MKKLIFLLSLLLNSLNSAGQWTEFQVHANGFIYSDTTMKQLEQIVDSLNIKFRTCEFNKTYYSSYQAKGHYIRLAEGDLNAAKADMLAGMSLPDFVKKYPTTTVNPEELIIRSSYEDYENQEIIRFISYPLEQRLSVKSAPQFLKNELQGKWVVDYWAKSKYNDAKLMAFYFTQDFVQKEIPAQYAQMVMYVDCMVDTNSQIFTGREEGRNKKEAPLELPKIKAFYAFVNESTERPAPGSKNYQERYWAWDSMRFVRINRWVLLRDKFDTLLNEAIEEALHHKLDDHELEEYAIRYHSAAAALALKRNRKVYGMCSQDQSPRYHAMEIAVLSAESVNWEVFLRAHLDIMNDRFDRASDGSYAWAARKTYLAELEALDINVVDLMLGMSLRIENPSENHYFGSIGRLGRALSETAHAQAVEAKMLEMINDANLDDFNRLLIIISPAITLTIWKRRLSKVV
ncbi:MAG: hypothetical protein Q8J69_10895 [Sphingobacteriaceae bacterium]|nr:hypothetical protein [Sphingobacteriaceae bacterium]